MDSADKTDRAKEFIELFAKMYAERRRVRKPRLRLELLYDPKHVVNEP